MTIKVSKSRKIINGDTCVLISSFSSHHKVSDLWFSVPLRWADDINTESMNAFVMGLLPAAMQLGEDIEVEGSVSERLLYQLNSSLIPMLTSVSDKFKKIQVKSCGFDGVSTGDVKPGAATGFSGGIDSFCVLADHLRQDVSPSFRLNTLLFNNVGAVPSHLFHEKWKQLSRITDLTGLDFIPVDSNLGSLINLPFHLTHSLRNVACSFVLNHLYDKYYYASACAYKSTHISKVSDIAYADPCTLNLMSSENHSIIASGGQYTRVEKTRLVSRFEPSYELLNVCVAANHIDNCSKCWKCGRTLLTLELLDSLDLYKNVFDLKRWASVRGSYIQEYITNPKKTHEPLTVEIHELAREKGRPFGMTDQAMGVAAAILPKSALYRLQDIISS